MYDGEVIGIVGPYNGSTMNNKQAKKLRRDAKYHPHDHREVVARRKGSVVVTQEYRNYKLYKQWFKQQSHKRKGHVMSAVT